ncbi:MAG: zinc-dependent metalloprotease [Deltaproteobacteria bacterium]|nr:zinc-dependent metalloprotease [Deltaproteobacteria bacterium]
MYRYLIAASALLFAASCGIERDPINQVQPNYVKKANLSGEWYYQRTVVDVPSSNGFTFVGGSDFSGLAKIRWDIQEDYLYARRTTELIKGADDKSNDVTGYKGEVIAAFAISKHFDIIKDYNPTTGEQINRVVENESDRPWYERDYMRIDWSANLVKNYQLDFEAASVEPVPYFVQKYDDPACERGTGELGDNTPPASDKCKLNPDAPYAESDFSYFDVTNKLFAKAGSIEIPGYGEVPLCWLRGEEFTECGAGEYSIRNSFLKIDDKRQYDPMPYKGKSTEMFGFFTADRLVYDGKQAVREQNKERYLTRHNLWVNWRDAQGKLIPYAQRKLRPIVYFVNRDFPEDLKHVAREVGRQYNETFTNIVKTLGHNPTGNVFILCENNPVKEGDPEQCGKAGNSPRLGDIRYSFMAYVPKFMEYGLLGLGPSNNDPETGEIFSGMAYVYHHNNTAAFRTQEMVELLSGKSDVNKYIDGVDLGEWLQRVNSGTTSGGRTHDLEAAKHMVEKLTTGWRAEYWKNNRYKLTATDELKQKTDGFDKWLEPHLDNLYYNHKILNGELRSANGRLAQLKGTYIEDLLLNKEMKLVAGKLPNDPAELTDDEKKRVSVVRGGFGRMLKLRAKTREKFAASRNMYLPEMADDALIGLARELKDKPTAETYNIIRTAIYTAVLTHEVGHSLGLMHNFGGSDDALNYHDEYWKIRDDGTVGPRLTDPITEAEKNAKIYNYAYSSVMDYAGRYTIDGKGLGKYDRAALMYGYAQKVEVYKDTVGIQASTMRDWHERDGEIVNFLITGPRATHYTLFYKTMGPKLYEASNRELVDASTLSADASVATINGKDMVRVPYIYCSHTRANLGDSCLTRDFGADSMERMQNILDELDTWYIQRNFPRGQVGVDHYGYVGNYYSRIYDRLKNWNDIYSLYVDLLPQFYSPAVLQGFFNDPENGWGDKTWAVQNAFNHLVQTVFSPNTGAYGAAAEQPDGTRVAKLAGLGTRIGVEDGRYYSTSWHDGARQCGYFWWECLHHIGYYLDKIMAIEALTDSETNFVARASPEDLRQWEVGYYNTFPEQIAKINSAMLRNDYSKLGPYMKDGVLTFPNYTGALDTAQSTVIDPYATFTVQLYWQVLGQARFFSNYDQSFLDDSRVFVIGTGKQPTLPSDKLYTFYDPQSHQTYGAIKMEGRTAGAHAVLARANALMARSAAYCDKDGKATPNQPDDDCLNPNSQAGGELIKHLDMIKVMADLNATMSFGNPYDP